MVQDPTAAAAAANAAIVAAPSSAPPPPPAAPPPALPAAALAVRRVCSSMGVDAMEPRVARALLDFVHRYTADVLLTAEAFAAAGDRPAGEVRAADVTLALQTQSASGAFCAPPAVADVAPLAAALNAVPLPPVQRRFGLRLPPEADCLTQPNWQVDLTEVGGAEETGVGAAGGTGGGAQQRAAGGRPPPAPPQPMPVRRTAAPVAPAQQQQQPAAAAEEDWEEGG